MATVQFCPPAKSQLSISHLGIIRWSMLESELNYSLSMELICLEMTVI